MGLGIDDWMVAWGYEGEVAVGRHPELYRSRTSELPRSAGNVFSSYQDLTLDQKRVQMLLDFHTLVVRDGVSIEDAHREFLKIDEYKYLISPDISGAEDRPEPCRHPCELFEL